jgi:3-hydroxybutyryl-CoA dehydrogenase
MRGPDDDHFGRNGSPNDQPYRGGGAPERRGDAIGRAMQPRDRTPSHAADRDLRRDADRQDARADQFREGRAGCQALEDFQNDECAHLEPNDSNGRSSELVCLARAGELSDEHGRHRRECDDQPEVIRHPDVRMARVVQDRGARLFGRRHRDIREPMTCEYASDGDAQRRGPASSAHGLDCRLTADNMRWRGAVDPRDVRQVGVVGCGLMGSGIVEVVARAGAAVTYVESDEDLVARGRDSIERSVAKAVERGKLEPADAEALLGRVHGITDLAGLDGSDLVIEAATEDLPAKLEIFRKLGTVTRPDVVLASNTSSIPIVELAVASGRPGRVIGMHFFNPPPVMALLELTPAITTSDETLAFVRTYGADVLGKTCVQAKDHAGFIVNRLLVPYLYDAVRLLDDGFASREDIDTAVRLGLSHPMGPLALMDLIGLDTMLSIGEVLYGEFRDERFAPPPLLRRMVAAGRLGRKSGGGFYDI